MNFIINNVANEPLDIFKTTIVVQARRAVMRYPMRQKEQALNDYLISNYKKNLKQICLEIIKETRIAATAENKVTVTFKTSETDKLALLITYGNSELMGSNILKKAFK